MAEKVPAANFVRNVAKYQRSKNVRERVAAVKEVVLCA